MGRSSPWFWLVAYIAAVYASSPFTGSIARSLGGNPTGQWLLTIVPLGAAGALVPVAVSLGYGRSDRWPIRSVAIAIALYTMVWWVLCQSLSEGVHMPLYGFMSLLALRALEGVLPAWQPYAGSVLLTTLASWGGELIQDALPNRVYDLRDVALDATSAVLATGIAWFLQRRPMARASMTSGGQGG